MKPPVIRAQKVVQALKKAGFYKDHQRGSHLVLRHQEKNRSVVVPIHSGTVPRGTLRAIIHQAEMTVEEFCSYLK